MTNPKKRKRKNRSNILTLVERHIIKENHQFFRECQRVCTLSKNLYNSTLYYARQSFFKRDYQNYYALNRIFTYANQTDYRALPAKVAKQTQMMVDANFKSYFALLKKVGNDPFVVHPKIPTYLKKDGYFITIYEKGALSFINEGFVRLSQTEIDIPTLIPRDKITSVRVCPKGNHFVIEICYDEVKPMIVEDNFSKVAFIDPGLNNLLTVTSNCFEPLIISGRKAKSINHYYNKQWSKHFSEVTSNTSVVNRVLGNAVYVTESMKRLLFWRNQSLDHHFHSITSYLVNQFVSHRISTVIFGHTKGQKQDIKLGKRMNQQFIQLPFTKLIDQLQYKCQLEGIHFITVEESYTSKASFIDQENIPIYQVDDTTEYRFSGKRIKRGLYETQSGKKINADVNGSLNIGRKYLTQKGVYTASLHEELLSYMTNPKVIRV